MKGVWFYYGCHTAVIIANKTFILMPMNFLCSIDPDRTQLPVAYDVSKHHLLMTKQFDTICLYTQTKMKRPLSFDQVKMSTQK